MPCCCVTGNCTNCSCGVLGVLCTAYCHREQQNINCTNGPAPAPIPIPLPPPVALIPAAPIPPSNVVVRFPNGIIHIAYIFYYLITTFSTILLFPRLLG